MTTPVETDRTPVTDTLNPADAMAEALEPCPFCGGEGDMSYFARAHSAEPAGHFVECITCAAAGPSFDIEGDMPDRVEFTKGKALAAWNARPASQPDKQAVERAREDAALLEDANDWYSQAQVDEMERAREVLAAACTSGWDGQNVNAKRDTMRIPIADALRALATIQPAQASDTASRADDGWVRVPREPTEAMIAAWENDERWPVTAEVSWSAMLAAAPRTGDDA